MMDKNKVALGLSGGVDSAVAANELKRRGYEVTGVTLTHACFSPEPARRAARELGIALVEVDIGGELEHKVCRAFEQSYLNGRTPNPCVICNPSVKFPALIEAADSIGAYHVATGHYARSECDEKTGRWALKKALCPNDQSYMLCRLTQDILSRAIFPLGDTQKDAVRGEAASAGLTAAEAPDSMEICFISGGDHAGWIRGRGWESEPGDFVFEDGSVIGKHDGIIGYTVGMRRGLSIPATERLYVKRIDKNTNSIHLAGINGMYTNMVEISDVFWVSGGETAESFTADVKLRHSRSENRATAIPHGNGMTLRFEEPVRIPAPGQFAALYDGDVVVCSGIIRGV